MAKVLKGPTRRPACGNLHGAVSEVIALVTFFYVRALAGTCPLSPLIPSPCLVSLPPALPTQQKEKKVNLKAEEGHSMILNCNPPQSSMQPIIHWMDWSEYISSPSPAPHYTPLPHRREGLYSFRCSHLSLSLCLYTLVRLQPTSTLFPFSVCGPILCSQFPHS